MTINVSHPILGLTDDLADHGFQKCLIHVIDFAASAMIDQYSFS
jgi:hypothetical protein